MRIVVLGALSEIAESACRHLAVQGVSFMLVGRDEPRLNAVAADLRTRGARVVHTATADLTTTDPQVMLADYSKTLNGIDGVLLAYGQLGTQDALAADPQSARELIDVNFGSAAAWCLAAANLFEKAGKGTLVVIGSVAGDRGRQSNFIYGASKAGLATLVEGIAHRLARTKARAVLVKPGLVATAMTIHMDRSGPLWSKPDAVGRIVFKSMINPRASTIYAPSFWKPIMLVIRSIPKFIFHRSNL